MLPTRIRFKEIVLAVGLLALVCLAALVVSPNSSGPEPVRPVTIAFLGFTNEPPFEGAPETLPLSLKACFLVTNHTASTLTYDITADGSMIGGNPGTSTTQTMGELRAYRAKRFGVSTPEGTNGWTFRVVSSISKPRPLWQQRLHNIARGLGTPGFLAGNAVSYPEIRSEWVP